MGKKVILAMSGGVDSSVAAYLLKNQGYDIIGITMQLLPKNEGGENSGCCGADDILDAKKVANILDIPHYVLNFRKLFQKTVINNFIDEYKLGRTPNPCIRCNQFLKFNYLLHKAEELSADYIATGHYARVVYSKKSSRFFLKKGKDRTKDQSYVLYSIKKQNLNRIIFPLGEQLKQNVKEIAYKLKFPQAGKKESQEICFIPDDDYGNYLAKHFPEMIKPGPISDLQGKIIGQHKGICFYTVGQRKGLGISAPSPMYVTAIDRKRNMLVVGKHEDCYFKGLVARELNFITDFNFSQPLNIKIRYRHQAGQATVKIVENNQALVIFKRPQWAVTPGQAVVFFRKDIVVGGGVIYSALRNI
ncbi:MAG: tRNA 2-thiouridine(34) synthase MnmA [Candidatus Omnitrophota bacterium]